jgi:hypothetical protein
MTDRHSGYVVTLDRDVREDDAEPILNAIRMIAGVVSVKPVVHHPGISIAESRAMSRMRSALFKALDDAEGDKLG